MDAFDLDNFLPYRLAVLAGRVSKGFARCYRKSFSLSVPEWRVMAHLSQADAVSVREIHERVDLDKSKVSRAAARLESAGLISKRTSCKDKRLIELSLTMEGQAMMAKLATLAHDFERDLLTALSLTDQHDLDRTLGALEDKMKCDPQ